MMIVLVAMLSAVALLSPVAGATPPSIPSADAARTELAALAVGVAGSTEGYSRELFPHWASTGNGCDTRDVVLQRDGTGVDTSCAVQGGSWFSPYDGATWTAASDVDIDHVVPLAEAWRSGASDWTTDKRGEFANDLDGPQLIAVTDNVNQSKGDQPPNAWKPPTESYWCTYASMWIDTKHTWKLTITSAEKTALTDMLSGC